MTRIGNSCGCGHPRRFHHLYIGDCFAEEDGYHCGCAGYVRNYIMLFRERSIT